MPQFATPLRAEILVGLGRARLALGDAAGAHWALLEADAFWRDFDPANRWATITLRSVAP